MKNRTILMATAAILAVGEMSASGQPYPGPPPGGDPHGYYSQYDQNGYYDLSGSYVRYRDPNDNRARNDGHDRSDGGYGPPASSPPGKH